jgi:hypothetical protein
MWYSQAWGFFSQLHKRSVASKICRGGLEAKDRRAWCSTETQAVEEWLGPRRFRTRPLSRHEGSGFVIMCLPDQPMTTEQSSCISLEERVEVDLSNGRNQSHNARGRVHISRTGLRWGGKLNSADAPTSEVPQGDTSQHSSHVQYVYDRFWFENSGQ